MMERIKISNFRSIKKANIELAPLVILYGPTAGGKSSLLYSMIILKNFINNPNQQLDGFFNLGFMNLGGFDNCVFNHDKGKTIEISYMTKDGEYGIALKKNSARMFLNSKIIQMEVEVSVPYPLNQNFTYSIRDESEEYTINWNGLSASISPKQPTSKSQEKARMLSQTLNKIPDYIRKIDIVPHNRGFFKPNYSPIPISQNPTSEDEVATLIINDPNLAPKISVDLEKILGRDFRIYTPPGTSTVFFQSTDKTSRMPSYLVNEGFGVNQIVYLLSKIHRAEMRTILVEEPEVHLHPSTIRNLVRVFCSIVREEEKQIILTTHSEVFVSSILAAIRRKDIDYRSVKFYFVEKEGKITKFEEQRVSEDGLIEGGLSSFVEGELEDLKAFFD